MGLFGRASGRIDVAINGDPKDLQRALGDADRSLGGFSKGQVAAAGAAIAGVFATERILDFGRTALAEGDRVGDALARLEGQVGGPLTEAIDNAAGGLEHLGQSRQDVLELSAAFADTATALGQGAPDIATWATKAAELAAALELQGVGDAAGNIDLIGKAAAGSERALRTLGVNLEDAAVESRALHDSGKDNPDLLTDSELAAARYAIVLETLQTRLGDTSQANGDLEQSLSEVDAKLETLTGKVGQAVEGPLNALLTWTLQGIEGWELYIERLGQVADAVRSLDGPVGAAIDILSELWAQIERAIGNNPGRAAFDLPSSSGPGVGGSGFGGWIPQSGPVTVNIQGGNPADVEDAVHQAIQGFAGKNGYLYPD